MTHEGMTVPTVTVARYAAPRVRAVPVTDVISSEPVKGRSRPGHYQTVLLDTRTGELRFHESSEHLERWNPAWRAVNDVPRETWNRWHPGSTFAFSGPHQWFEPVPELLSWIIDSGVEELPYLDAGAANALLDDLMPVAQCLLDGLFDGGGDLDWSADSARAGRNLNRLVSRDRKAAGPEADAELVDFAEIVSRFPQVYEPEKLRHPLDELAEACEWTTRYVGCNKHWHQEIKTEFGKPYSDGCGISLEVLGVRSWYRTVLMAGDPRPLKMFRDWDTEHGRLTASPITSASTDADLDTWADREDAHAARQGWRLLNTQEAAHEYRTQLRARDWDRLAVVSADLAALEETDDPGTQEELEPRRTERTKLVAAAIGWGHSDREVAIRARIPRRTVFEVRESASSATTGSQPR